MKSTNQLIQGQSFSFDQYMELFEDLVKAGQTTGPNQSESMAHYTKLNLSRTKRWLKKMELNKELLDVVHQIKSPQQWTVITETWCGDAAHILPWIELLAQSNEQISLRIVLRDENPALMDEYLTDGVSRSIPILIAEDAKENVIFHWGPRPRTAQSIMIQAKKEKTPYSELSVALQKWYNDNRGVEIQMELLNKLGKSA